MKKFILLIFTVVILVFSCKDYTKDQQDTHAHDVEEELTPEVYTIFDDIFELFVEFNPLVVGHTSTFITHYTRLSDFKPVAKGELSIHIQGMSSQISNAIPPDQPGIFRPEIIPEQDGIISLVFQLSGPGYQNEIVIDSVIVYKNLHEAQHALEGEGYASNDIPFLKEQVWKIDFKTVEILPQTFHEVIRTSGEIIQSQGDEFILTAQHSGIVLFRKTNILAGSEVKKGESLFNISSGDLVEDNVKEEYLHAKAQFEKSKQDYERAQLLIKDRLITESEFLEIQLDFESASNTYNTFKNNYYEGGAEVRSPETGFVKYIYVAEGQYVETGHPLAAISKNKKLVIKADVSQKYFQQLKSIRSANFRTVYDDKLYNTDDLEGVLISYGKNVERSAFYTPIYFEINNIGNFIPGSFIEVFLKGAVINDAIIIPKTAIMEEIGNYFVYVQSGGESYQKRDVTIGDDDGINVRILSGLEKNERIVTEGAFRIRIASMSSELPSHGHVH